MSVAFLWQTLTLSPAVLAELVEFGASVISIFSKAKASSVNTSSVVQDASNSVPANNKINFFINN
jgi:hypothetical protein